MLKTKACTKCKEVKGFDEFYSDRTHNDGLTSRCRECLRAIDVMNRHKITFDDATAHVLAIDIVAKERTRLKAVNYLESYKQ